MCHAPFQDILASSRVFRKHHLPAGPLVLEALSTEQAGLARQGKTEPTRRGWEAVTQIATGARSSLNEALSRF